MKEFLAETVFWPLLAWLNVQDEDNMGDDRFLSAFLFVILVVGVFGVALVLARVPEMWKIVIPAFFAAYLCMGSAHAYATGGWHRD